MLGYLCAYYRYYHPLEFITSFLNNAANDEDIRNGTEYATKTGIKVTMPKWGFSKSDYFYDNEKRVIAKGLASIKFISANLAEELYEIARNKTFNRFVDVLAELAQNSSINRRQLDVLIKIDFFSDFGNQRELIRIAELYYDTFKQGQSKKISKESVDGTPLEPIIKKYAVGVTKSGGVAKFYTLLDVESILHESEDLIKSVHMQDLSDYVKVQNFKDLMGYVGYTSGKQEDRRKLFVLDIFPVKRKRDGKQFGYNILTKSIGSGVEARFTVFNREFNKEPIKAGDIIHCNSFERDGAYFTLTGYSKIYA